MLKRLACAALLAFGLSVCACEDDEHSGPDAGRSLDAAAPQTGRPDGGGPDANPDAAKDGGTPKCNLDFVAIGEIDLIVHVALDEYCATHRCPTSLAAMEARVRCFEAEDGGGPPWEYVDAGAIWSRRRGCGRLLFDSFHESFQFGAESGALVGAASVGDTLSPIPGTNCQTAGTEGGTILGECDGDRFAACE